jgi:hypothetical protein
VVRFKTSEGNIIPGKLVESNRIAEVPYGGVRTSSIYQVLTNPNPNRPFKWIRTSSYNMPDGALLADREEQNSLYVGQVVYSSNLILVGKYNAPCGALFHTYEGRKKGLKSNLEVLCRS